MSFSKPGYHIPRRSVAGHEADWVKSFDPPKASPPTPDLLEPTNPVPAFVARNVPGATMLTPNTQRVDLMHGTELKAWDGKKMEFFILGNPDVPMAANGTFPGPTIRVPRGVIFHGEVQGHGQPPHTIHWHGIEPTAINDGVGHTSMEIGTYTYQWQPNHIGSYFYHCHRNTIQHFEFGLYGFLIIEPPDAYDPKDGKNVGGYPRRTAANLVNFPEFPGFVDGTLDSGDPHAMTVPYDVEALWVIDDIDSVWRIQAENAHQTFPEHGDIPGVNDDFHSNDKGSYDFFAFQDYNPDYFVVTGEYFPGRVGGTASIRSSVTIPPELNSGVTGMQVSVNAKVNQTILVRMLCGAYVKIKVVFPVDVVCIAYDGRSLGVPPFGKYNYAYTIKAGTPIEMSTAQRCDVLIRTTKPINSYAQVEYRHHLSDAFLFNGRIPFVVK
ncbi:multicopper oxidase domain-containing protein [Bacillus sp. UNC41MFS5]|uniref:multicopper oxidase domain-containing protein n=1 Tax=Bacillus sp. UNC41MFS5 TaxID=1449046 RepID=UPI00047B98A8|nr:multicopper oxidase domain-containing protein [Bacillus sp. UNC41MFS5]